MVCAAFNRDMLDLSIHLVWYIVGDVEQLEAEDWCGI